MLAKIATGHRGKREREKMLQRSVLNTIITPASFRVDTRCLQVQNFSPQLLIDTKRFLHHRGFSFL